MSCRPALKLLSSPTVKEQAVIGAFSYQPNDIVVHGDTSFMPKARRAWSSWVYLSETSKDQKPVISLSYWMNSLQNIDPAIPVIVTLNPERQPNPAKVFDRYTFEHPVFNVAALTAQSELATLQGENNTWYCGAYQRYGFHEDGLLSAYSVVQALGIKHPFGLPVNI